jgi:hypothetical protein
MFVLIHMALTSSEPTPFLQTLFNMLISPAAVCLLGDALAIFLAYCLGRADYSQKWKAALWLAIAGFFVYCLYDFLTVGLRSDADIYKPFLVWQLFLMVLVIPIDAFMCRKKR